MPYGNKSTAVLLLTGVILFLVLGIIAMIILGLKKLRQNGLQAITDPVTGGLNRTGFVIGAEKTLRRHGATCTFVVMDLRNFRQIQQSFGFTRTNQVLLHIFKSLKSCLSGAEIACRNNHAFIFLLKNREKDEISARLKLVNESVNRFNRQRQDPYPLRLCFGVYTPQSADEPVADIIEKAEQTLDEPGDIPRYRFYDSAEREFSPAQLELLEQTERSLQNGDFSVYLQPMVRLGDSRVVGAEALVRWRHPMHGILPPDRFLPVMEKYHTIHRLDLYILERICQKLSSWQRSGWEPCPIALNLSREDMDVRGFLSDCAGVCKRYGVDPELITFELQERVFLGHQTKLRALIDEIHALGFRCALDNFGKTTISLDMMRELELDVIKLDSSFFYSQNNTRRNRYIIEALLKLAAQMNIATVAEKIENASQVQYLQKATCDMVQGSYFYQPMTMEEFDKAVYRDGHLRYMSASSDSRGAVPAELPITNSNLVMFTYHPEDDRIVFSTNFSPVLDSKLSHHNVKAILRSSDLIHENDRNDFLDLLDRCRKESGWVENVFRFYTSAGRYEWLEAHLHQEEFPVSGEAVIFGTLINKNEVARWKEKADRDALTGLYNRDYFERTAREAIENNQLSSGAMVFIDVDDFKHVNDSFGHVVGDDVLCSVAKRVLGVFRHTDTVARYGGDEFVVFVNNISRADLEKRLTQLCESFRYPYRNDTINYRISCSIGGAVFPEDGVSYQTLLDHADNALYVSKEKGKDQYTLYRPGMVNKTR